MGERLRILAIEDDPDLSYLYESLLGQEGHRVTTAKNAEQALHRLDEHPDVVLLDLMIPGMDGYTLLRRMRERRDLRDTPVVVVSAAVPPGRTRIAGADDVVAKPFEFDRLLRAVEGAAHRVHASHGMHAVA